MFPHAARLVQLLSSRRENPDLIVQIINDSRYVHPRSIDTYCRLLENDQVLCSAHHRIVSRPMPNTPIFGALSNLRPRPLVVVLTRNSALWIAKQATYFKRSHIDAVFYVDSRSVDHTISMLADAGATYCVHRTVGESPETGMYKILRDFPNRWLLRLDDDEILSPLAYQDICTRLDDGLLNEQYCYSFPRRWVFWSDADGLAQTFVSRYQVFLDHDYQPRLFFSGSVKHNAALHTAGYTLLSGFSPIILDRYCEILHFDALVHSLSDRLLKLAKYDSMSPGNFTRYKSFYLPETIPLKYHCAIPFQKFECDPDVLTYGSSLANTL